MQVGVITGAASGMGWACAEQLLGTVDVLLLADRDEVGVKNRADTLAKKRSQTIVEPLVLDVTDDAGLKRLADRAAGHGQLRSVVHAAGISPTMADWRKILDVDLVGTAKLVENLWPLVVPETAVVCFASMAAFLFPGPFEPASDAVLDNPLDPQFLDSLRESVGSIIEDFGMGYVWAKRGVHRLVQREAIRFGRAGARICSLSPGIIDTPMAKQEADANETNALLVQMTPLGRQGRPEEIASAVEFLLSPQASFINGIDLLVDGGVVAAIRSGLPLS